MAGDGWTWTLVVILLIFTYRLLSPRFHFFFGRPSISSSTSSTKPKTDALSYLRTPEMISDLDLENLINNLDESSSDNIWENVIDKSNNFISYKAKCCKPKDGPLKYLSVTTFEDCSVEVLVNFYMDNSYRMQWDKTVVCHQQLQVDHDCGTEIGRTIKKFPFLTPREYVLAWRIWQGMDGSFYCFSKECQHPLAPKEKRYVRVAVFRSGWRIRKGRLEVSRLNVLHIGFLSEFLFAVPGRNACEIRMVHQEDAGLNVEMAKLAFAKGIWSYVCKMDDALRRYSAGRQHQLNSTIGANMSIRKVPPEFEVTNDKISTVHPENSMSTVNQHLDSCGSNKRKLTRRPSNKLIANGLVLLGGAICLSRGHSSLGTKVAMAYLLSKLTKHGASSKKAGKLPRNEVLDL
ncbi:hypothetical protein DH2020_016814 [Rehmannia glutinosa]|uniref:START domain-containing protein n=1 Tax=Rehmannia glutinosa TaxID=99300 RepID=A0ABR0WQ62_REHGL